MAVDSELISVLTRLGFTQYEAQAYTALVGRAAITGAEVGRRAGMPPSKVYETLTRLEARGAVLVNRSEPVRYTAVPHHWLLQQLRARYDTDVEAAQAALDRLPTEREPGLVWSLSGRDAIIHAFTRTIAEAKQSIFAGIWDEELDEFRGPLEAAPGRGIQTHVAIYGPRTLTGPHTYDLTECGASARLRLSGRRLAVVVADDTDAIVAEFGDRSPDHATLTTNPIIALLAVEYLKADISGRLLINAMDPDTYQQLLTTPGMKAMLRPITDQAPQTRSEAPDA
ncbi:TrmB family transcriptional regulator [Fodinicola acaciae]|uniref:TrmB family transcriptional regulator n=1 Tax=Fodinicola acaciae TaxID=2681555 RepID=UPI0013D892EF|nr:TrmB family transcriptional regulator [Fodinicola acaciae]